MLGLSVENRRLEGHKTLSGDLAQHIQQRYHNGKIAIVTDRPVALMSVVSKQWQKIIRQVARERSSTLGFRSHELSDELERMQSVTFTAMSPIEDPLADISFATVEQSLQAPPICHTLYIVSNIKRHEQYMLAVWMPPRAVVVIYDLQ